MKKQMMFHIDWNENEAVTYYVGRRRDGGESVATYDPQTNRVRLRSYCGTYTFSLDDDTVTLDDGARVRPVTAKRFKLYETPVP